MANLLTFKALGLLGSMARRARGERGQDLIEYSMLGGILAASIIGVAYLVLTGSIDSMFAGIGNCIDWQDETGCFP